MATSREQELVNILTEASSAYYTNGKSKLSDEEFKRKYDTLLSIVQNKLGDCSQSKIIEKILHPETDIELMEVVKSI